MKIWAWCAAAAVLLSGALAACGSGESSGSTQATTGTGGPACGATMFSTLPQCQACVEGLCCAELAACTTGTPCGALLACLAAAKCGAGDASCITSCEDANSAGVEDAQALEGCYTASCAMQSICQSGEICQSGLSVPNVQCGICLGASCCSEWTACDADATCLSCVTGNMTSVCDTDDAYKAATQCESNLCSMDCTQICDTGITTDNPACDLCLGANCCMEVQACIGDSTCDTCLLASTPPASCSTDNFFAAATACQMKSCATQCQSGG